MTPDLIRQELTTWIRIQREALPERRKEWAHGAAETLEDLRRELDRIFGHENIAPICPRHRAPKRDCCGFALDHDHGDCDGYIFTARDYWRGMYALDDSLAHWDDVRTLFDHGPYKDHCGGYEVHAWPCSKAADILSVLREKVGHEAWLRIDYFAESATSDACPAEYERDCDWWPADGITERCSMCLRDRPRLDDVARSRDAVAGMATWPHPCGHVRVESGCGGCDPSAIDHEFGGEA